MEMTASPTDFIHVVDMARQIEGNPMHLAGRFLGLGEEEQQGGVPTWTWAVLALGAGAVLAHRYWPQDGLKAIT